MDISLIALDLDDTLLDSELDISKANIEAVAAAEKAGIEIVLASGRNYRSMKKYVLVLGLDRPGNYLVCSNGAETLEAMNGVHVERLFLTEAFCHEAVSIVESHGFSWQVYLEDRIYASELNDWALLDQRLSGLPLLPSPPKDKLFKGGQIKFVIPGDPESIAQLNDILAKTFEGKAVVVTSKPYFLEILPLGADKGSALRRLSAKLGIGMDRVMVVGDAMNDLGMITAAGWGCAPANARDEVKKAARVVSLKTNEEDAVADLIYSVALGGRRPKTV
ncbi:MAG: Cof-type HAD-IIB family hydrolase [Spirochaetes bacterium]|nr:Cof-type HAD-IIB family hydrolase [Spirochaetota bacterium]